MRIQYIRILFLFSMKRKSQNNFIMQDISIIALSILIAIILVRTDALVRILTTTQELEFIGSFITGLFFTSVFTTAPSIVTLGEIAQVNTIAGTAFFGALGAVIGDLVIFKFVRDRFSDHLLLLIKEKGNKRRFKALLKLKFFRFSMFMLGGLIIASPFPDELGISLMGFSKMRLSLFIPVSFVFNFIGIYIIGIIARSVL